MAGCPSHVFFYSSYYIRKTAKNITFDFPEIVVLDNGQSFTSQEFADFIIVNGISHVRASLYHLSSNGLAE